MKIVYSGLENEYYNPRRGLSFEHNNFYLSLKEMPEVEVAYFPYDPIIKIGKERFNEELLRFVRTEKPDLFFAFMFTDEFDKRVLDEIKKITTSVAWLADDHWRLWNYSRFYAPHFTWVVTTWSKAAEIYAKYGITNVIRSQWACNPVLWKPVGSRRTIDVSFIGQKTPGRMKIIEKLRVLGINVYARGFGWPDGRISREEMVEIFSRSKININLNSPPSLAYWKILARLFMKRSIDKIVPDFSHLIDNAKSVFNMRIPQIKARPFEILGCRAFLISGYADDMNRYYEDKKEIVYYDGTINDLTEKIRYYLEHSDEREKIAEAGYQRTLRDHTYEKRFREVFRAIGVIK
jgi:spore maturation protein CgeB